MQQSGRQLEETLQQTQLQQSQHQGRLHEQSRLLPSQHAADIRNQQLETQLAHFKQEKAESNKILSMQTEIVKNLEELVKNMIEAPSKTAGAESLENRSAERKI